MPDSASEKHSIGRDDPTHLQQPFALTVGAATRVGQASRTLRSRHQIAWDE